MWKKIKQQWDENPLACVIVGSLAAGALLGGVAKVISASSEAKGRNAYARQIDYRIKQGL